MPKPGLPGSIVAVQYILLDMAGATGDTEIAPAKAL